MDVGEGTSEATIVTSSTLNDNHSTILQCSKLFKKNK